MGIAAREGEGDTNIVEIGLVTLELPLEVVKGLHDVVQKHLNVQASEEKKVLEKKIAVYRALASKMKAVDDIVVQKLASQIKPEHLVTLVRLSQGNGLYKKVMKNLSRQSAQQFKMDYENYNAISEHQACVYMEHVVPYIKKAVQDKKRIMSQEVPNN